MKRKPSMKRIGRFWVDRALLKEGYRLRDIIEDLDTPRIELPELFDSARRMHIGWVICPECGERSQVDRRDPSCSSCGWEPEAIGKAMRCAA